MSTTTQAYFTIELCMEDGSYITWENYADDQDHAEGLAVAYANEKTGEQVDSVFDVKEWEVISERQAYERYDDMLDDCYPLAQVCGFEYAASHALKELDPIAYRCGFSDYTSSLEEDNVKVEGF